MAAMAAIASASASRRWRAGRADLRRWRRRGRAHVRPWAATVPRRAARPRPARGARGLEHARQGRQPSQIAAAAWLLIIWPQMVRSRPGKPGSRRRQGRGPARGSMPAKSGSMRQSSAMPSRAQRAGGEAAGAVGSAPAASGMPCPRGRRRDRSVTMEVGSASSERSPLRAWIATLGNSPRAGYGKILGGPRERRRNGPIVTAMEPAPAYPGRRRRPRDPRPSLPLPGKAGDARHRRARCAGSPQGLAARPLPPRGAGPDDAGGAGARLRALAARAVRVPIVI